MVTREDTREKLRADLPESCSLENKHRAAQQILLSLRREGNREREREREEARRIERYNETSKGREKQAVGRVWQHIITVISGTSN